MGLAIALGPADYARIQIQSPAPENPHTNGRQVFKSIYELTKRDGIIETAPKVYAGTVPRATQTGFRDFSRYLSMFYFDRTLGNSEHDIMKGAVKTGFMTAVDSALLPLDNASTRCAAKGSGEIKNIAHEYGKFYKNAGVRGLFGSMYPLDVVKTVFFKQGLQSSILQKEGVGLGFCMRLTLGALPVAFKAMVRAFWQGSRRRKSLFTPSFNQARYE